MPRVKTGFVRRRRHKKVLKAARGFFSGRRKHFRKAKEQLERSLVYAYRDRRQKKRDIRKLWIIRINAIIKHKESKAKIKRTNSEDWRKDRDLKNGVQKGRPNRK